MKKVLFLILLITSGAAKAEGYLDLGLAVADSGYVHTWATTCGYSKYSYSCDTKTEEVHGIIGIVEFGYTYDSLTFFVRHESLAMEEDGKGLNMAGVKARIRLFE